LQRISLKLEALAQARGVPVTQVVDSLLGDIATEALGGFLHTRLGEPSSPKRDHPSPKGEVPRLG